MKALIITLGIVIVLGVGAFWLHAGPQSAPPAPQTTILQATSSSPLQHQQGSTTQTAASSAVEHPLAITHTVGVATATPSLIAVGNSTQVTVTIQITDPALIPNSINLLLLGATGTQPTILGVMQSTGNGGYSLQHNFDEPAAGQIQLQVSAAFQGSLQRVLSNVVTVTVNAENVFTDPSSGLTFILPPLGSSSPTVNNLGPSTGNQFTILVGAVDPIDHLTHPLFSIIALSNSSQVSLQQWFETNIDDASGTLLESGAFQEEELAAGPALVLTGSIPSTYLGGPVADAYMLSSSTGRIYVITQSQDGTLVDFGYSAASVPVMLASILGSLN
jgi:hypothetical protein